MRYIYLSFWFSRSATVVMKMLSTNAMMESRRAKQSSALLQYCSHRAFKESHRSVAGVSNAKSASSITATSAIKGLVVEQIAHSARINSKASYGPCREFHGFDARLLLTRRGSSS
jgi:hypothetical protein